HGEPIGCGHDAARAYFGVVPTARSRYHQRIVGKTLPFYRRRPAGPPGEVPVRTGPQGERLARVGPFTRIAPGFAEQQERLTRSVIPYAARHRLRGELRQW